MVTTDMLPGIGDAAEVYSIVQDVKNKNYGAALAGLGLLAIPGNIANKTISSIKNKYGKQGLIRSIYINIAPGSYYESYIPNGNKRTEIKNAIKDYLAGRGDKINPKWVYYYTKSNAYAEILYAIIFKQVSASVQISS